MSNLVQKKLAWYVHVPFCIAKCHYCDFYSLGMGTKEVPEQEFIQALQREITQWKAWLKPEAHTILPSIFWGGGTPSLLSAQSVQDILNELFQFGETKPQEITLEMNPRTASEEKLIQLRAAGINRLSIGVQSLNDKLLKNLGREHNGAAVHETLTILQKLAWENWNVDLMYGLPDQSLADLESTLEALQAYGLKHLSAYELILEEHTPFFERYQYERNPLPTEDTVLAMGKYLAEFAAQQGLQPYEISNWAKPGYECRHNLHYWNYLSFIGLGPSAVSFLRWDQLTLEAQDYFLTRLNVNFDKNKTIYGLRLTQPRSLKAYLQALGDVKLSQVEIIENKMAFGEFFMMNLRKRKGFHASEFEQLFGEAMPEVYQESLFQAEKKDWLQFEQGRWFFTEAGILLSNEVMGDLVGMKAS